MRDNPIFEEDFDEKPKGSAGHWLALILVAVLFALAAAFVPTLLAHADMPQLLASVG